MVFLRKKSIRVVFLFVLALVLAAATYGFAAGNTVPDHKAGDGSGTVTGYTVSNIAYTLTTGDPTTVSAVDFDLDASAGTVKITFDDTTWYDCTISGGTAVSCNVSSGTPTVLSIDSLRVVATE